MAIINLCTNSHIASQFPEYTVLCCESDKKHKRELNAFAGEILTTWTDCLESYSHAKYKVYLLCKKEKKAEVLKALRLSCDTYPWLKIKSSVNPETVDDYIMLNLLLNRLMGKGVARYAVCGHCWLVIPEKPWVTQKQIHALELRFVQDMTFQVNVKTFSAKGVIKKAGLPKQPVYAYYCNDTSNMILLGAKCPRKKTWKKYVKAQMPGVHFSKGKWLSADKTQKTKFEHGVVPILKQFEKEYSLPLQFQEVTLQKKASQDKSKRDFRKFLMEHPITVALRDDTGEHSEEMVEIESRLEKIGVTVDSRSESVIALEHAESYFQVFKEEEDTYQKEWNVQHLALETWNDKSKNKDALLATCLCQLEMERDLVQKRLTLYPWNEAQDWIIGGQQNATVDDDTGEMESGFSNVFMIIHPDKTMEWGTYSDFERTERLDQVMGLLKENSKAVLAIQRGDEINVIEDTDLFYLPFDFLNLLSAKIHSGENKGKPNVFKRTTAGSALEKYCPEMINTNVFTLDGKDWFYSVETQDNPNTASFGSTRTLIRKIVPVGNSMPFMLDYMDMMNVVFVSYGRKRTVYPFWLGYLRLMSLVGQEYMLTENNNFGFAKVVSIE